MTARTFPPLVALHGFLGCAADWDELFGDLRRDRACHAIDLPGHGACPPPSADEPLSPVAEALTTATKGLGPVDYLGYSMGGRLLFQLADDPRLPPWRRMVLVGAHPGIEDEAERERRRASDAELARQIQSGDLATFLDHWYAQPLFGQIQASTGYAAMHARRLEGDPSGLAHALERLGPAVFPSRLARMRAPSREILLVAGANDTKYRTLNERLAKQIRGARAVTIPDTGHAPQVERPKVFHEVVRAFLDG